jgi:hypothetical protein
MEAEVDALLAAAPGITPILSWEPMGGEWSRWTHDMLLGATYDAYIDSWADKIVAKAGMWGLANKPIVIRLMHEQNANWYPWSPSAGGQVGNSAAKYVQVWRKIHARFAAKGANSYVKWEWSPIGDPVLDANVTNRMNPNANGEHRNIAETYPGHAYVGQVSFSFYNHGTTPYTSAQYAPNGWTPTWRPVSLMEWDAYRVRAISGNDKRLRIAEVGSGTGGGDKAQWVRDLFVAAPTWGVKEATWFDNDWSGYNQRDWRIKEPDAAAFSAWQQATTSASTASAGWRRPHRALGPQKQPPPPTASTAPLTTLVH